MVERVQLVGRPGNFFVVARALGRVQLLGPNDEELSVTPDQVKPAAEPVEKAPRAIGPRSPKEPRDFSQYGGLLRWLYAHREHVYFSIGCPECQVARVCDRYLDMTGEELNPEWILLRPLKTKAGKRNWNSYTWEMAFPALPAGTLVPSAVRGIVHWAAGNFRYQEMSNNDFTWYLFEHHGFRIRRRDAGR